MHPQSEAKRLQADHVTSPLSGWLVVVLVPGLLAIVPPDHRCHCAWIAEFEQPCEEPEVCSFHLEVSTARGEVVLGELDVEARGCGTHRVDIGGLLAGLEDPGFGPPRLRVWSVNCSGIRSQASDWVLLDLEDGCTGMTITSHDGLINEDAGVDISDPIALMSFLFWGGPRPCSNAADANNDGYVDVSDVIHLLHRLFVHPAGP